MRARSDAIPLRSLGTYNRTATGLGLRVGIVSGRCTLAFFRAQGRLWCTPLGTQPGEIREMWPLLDTTGMLGAAFIPGDGMANPTDVTQAMARDPAQRYPAAKALVEDLRRFLTGQLVGASPIQNIGAYGQDLSQTLRRVRALDRRTGFSDRREARHGRPPRERVVQDVEIPLEAVAAGGHWREPQVSRFQHLVELGKGVARPRCRRSAEAREVEGHR